MGKNKHCEHPINEVFKHPSEVLIGMMKMNLRDANSIFELCKNSGCLDSQEFMDWQDELNAISVKY